MKKLLAILATPTIGLLIAVAAPVAVNIADAHTPQVVPSCTGLTVIFVNYEGNAQNNMVLIGVDAAPPLGQFFASSYQVTVPWSQTVAHDWSVTIDANRNTGNQTQYDAFFSGSWKACQPAPTTTSSPPTTSTAPSTTVVGPTSTLGSTPTTVAVSTDPTTTVVFAVDEPPVPDATVPVVVGQLSHSDVLPRTGASEWFTFGLALILVGLGSIAALVTRRRA